MRYFWQQCLPEPLSTLKQLKLQRGSVEFPRGPLALYLKNAPLMTAFGPAVNVTLIFTCPDSFQM